MMPVYNASGVGAQIDDAVHAMKGVSKLKFANLIGQLEGIAELVVPITRTVVSIETIASLRPELGKKLAAVMQKALDALEEATAVVTIKKP